MGKFGCDLSQYVERTQILKKVWFQRKKLLPSKTVATHYFCGELRWDKLLYGRTLCIRDAH